MHRLIECMIGQLKVRSRCLLGVLTTQKLTRSVLVLKACITLYNFRIMHEPISYDEVIRSLDALPDANENDEFPTGPSNNDPVRRRMIFRLALDNT